MTGTSRQFVKDFLFAHPTPGKVLEIGSRNVNGTVKYLFRDAGWEYLGLDMINGGEFTDVVCNAHDLKKVLKRASFDLVMTLDTLEHDNKFWLSDYYRFLLPVMQEVWFEGFGNCYFKSYGDETSPDAIYGWGQKV